MVLSVIAIWHCVESVPFSGQQNSVAQTVPAGQMGRRVSELRGTLWFTLYREKRIFGGDFGKRPPFWDAPLPLSSS